MSGWHILQEGQSKGPYTDDQLKALCEAGVLTAASLAWKSDYPNWRPLADTDFVYKSLLSPPPFAGSARPAAFAGTGQQEVENLSLWQYFIRTLTDRYATFHGRARRKEYWGTVLFYIIFIVLLAIAGVAIDGSAGNLAGRDPKPVATAILIIIFSLITFLPSLALFVRRLHDVGLSGWLILVAFIPYAGAVFALVIALIPSEPRANKHGPCPKLITA